MAQTQEKIITRNKLSAEGEAMNVVFKKATRKAAKNAFSKRKSIMIEKDGWLVMVNKDGKVVKKVKKLEKLTIPSK